MRTKRATLCLLLAALAAGPAAAAPGETRVLSNFTGEGEWQVSQWSKAKGRLAIRPEAPPDLPAGADKKSLGLKISFPGGGGFHFCNIEPAKPAAIENKLLGGSVWIKPAGTKHYVEVSFQDANGTGQKLGLGTLEGSTWEKRTFKIPANWKQPLKLASINFHDWGINEPAEATLYLARLEIEVDPKVKAGQVEKKVYVALPRVKVPGRSRVYSDLNIPGEWKPDEWNKAAGTMSMVADFPEEVKTVEGELRQSLQLRLQFGAGFQFFGLVPLAAEPIPYRVVGVQMWVKGSDTPHSLVLNFTGADGKEVKTNPKPEMNFYGWQQVTATIPKEWKQPLTFKGITLHNWEIQQPVEFSLGLTRMEVIIDPNQKVGGPNEAAKTNDNW